MMVFEVKEDTDSYYSCFNNTTTSDWSTHPLAGRRIRPVPWSPTGFDRGFSPSFPPKPCAPECGTLWKQRCCFKGE